MTRISKAVPTFESFIAENSKGIKDGDTIEIIGGEDASMIGKKGVVNKAYSDSVAVSIENTKNVDEFIYDNDDIERVNESSDIELAKSFKDSKGKNPKTGDLITDEDGNVGQVKSFRMEDNKSTTNTARMSVDFRSHILELNPNSKFEIIENPDDKLKKAFESNRKSFYKAFEELSKSLPEFNDRFRRTINKKINELCDEYENIDRAKILEIAKLSKDLKSLLEAVQQTDESYRDEVYNDIVHKIDDLFGIKDKEGEGKAIHIDDLQELIEHYKLNTIQAEYLAKVLKEKGWAVEEGVLEASTLDDVDYNGVINAIFDVYGITDEEGKGKTIHANDITDVVNHILSSKDSEYADLITKIKNIKPDNTRNDKIISLLKNGGWTIEE